MRDGIAVGRWIAAASLPSTMVDRQPTPPLNGDADQLTGEGLRGFTDFAFLWQGLLSLTLAAALAAPHRLSPEAIQDDQKSRRSGGAARLHHLLCRWRNDRTHGSQVRHDRRPRRFRYRWSYAIPN